MSEAYFTPWMGDSYDAHRVLIVSESTYTWIGDDGETYIPTPAHAEESIPWHITNFGQNRYFTALNRALSGEYQPSSERMRQVWKQCAYTVFVQEPVGDGPGKRPTLEHWKAAGPPFLQLLEAIRPLKVIITGGEMWNQMPHTSARILDDLQAYRLSNGDFVWCLALPHPANRTKGQGFSWEKMAESIKLFRSTTFPISDS